MKTPDEIRSLLDISRYVHFHAGDREAHISPLEVLQFEDAVAVVISHIQELEERVQYGITAFETIHDEARKLEAILEEYEKPLVPLTLPEAAGTNEVVWLEQKNGRVFVCDLVYSCLGSLLEVYTIGNDDYGLKKEDDYGITWRCWSRKPTDEERKAAKWDE